MENYQYIYQSTYLMLNIYLHKFRLFIVIFGIFNLIKNNL
jgi:hypothetical protein